MICTTNIFIAQNQSKYAFHWKGSDHIAILTNHAKSRLKERCGLNKSSFDRIAEKAYQFGISHKETKGNLNKWITSLYFYDKTANNIKLYGDKAYLFKDDKLITVLPIPHDLIPAVNKIRKNKKGKSIGSN